MHFTKNSIGYCEERPLSWNSFKKSRAVVTISLDQTDSELSRRLQEATGEQAISEKRNDDLESRLIHNLKKDRLGMIGAKTVLGYLLCNSLSSYSSIKRDTTEKPLSAATAFEMLAEIASG